MSLTIGVDVGGTKVAAGVVDTETGNVVARLRRATPAHDGQAMAETVTTVVRELATRYPVAAVGLGVPGFVNRTRDDITLAPNLALPERPLIDHVREVTGLATTLENDANAAAWAEYRFGVAAGHEDVLMITAGTGIGGGGVLGGRVYRGAGGSAFEVGHLRVVPGGLPCGCGNLGCWEAYGSGAAMTRRAQALVAADGVDAAALRDRCGGLPQALTGAMITAAAEDGDPLSRQLLADTGAWLGAGIASLVAVLDPGVVVIGGGLAEAGNLVLTPLRTAYLDLASGAGRRQLPDVVPARLGNDAGIVGIADLAASDRQLLLAHATTPERTW